MKILELSLYQILVVFLSLFMIAQGFVRYTKKESGQTTFKFLIRIAVWGGMMVIVLYPGITYKLASAIGIVGNINAVILTGFILVFIMIFKLLSSIEKIEQKISELTREEALRKIKKED